METGLFRTMWTMFKDLSVRDEITITSMTVDDLPAVLRIEKESGLSSWAAADYLQELEKPDSAAIMGWINNERAGFLIARLITKDTAELYNIGVSKPNRRKNVATVLIRYLTELCRIQRIANIWLEVRQSNEAAISFYRQNSFQISGKRKNFYESPAEDALMMSLSVLPDASESTDT